MKKLFLYGILCFSMSKLLGEGTISQDNQFYVKYENLRELLLSMIPSGQQGENAADVMELAKLAAVHIPYNAVLRQILLLPDLKAEAVFADESTGELSDQKSAETFFLDKLLYIKWDLNSSDTNRAALLDSILNGLVLEFSPDVKKTFCIFERSASQQRQNTLVMIGEKIVKPDDPSERTVLESRISCGIPQDVEVIASKYAAYRALMMTSGVCIPHTAELDKYLEAEHILVIPDKKVSDWNRMLKNDPGVCTDCTNTFATVESELENGEFRKIKYAEKEITTKEDKLFDGEGLISKEFGEFLIGQTGSSRKTASFQVRMPFVKGVLHKVDFHAMFRDLLGNSYDTAYLEDYYKRKVLLRDVHMILTASMFKMYKVYQTIAEKKQKNGFDYYFEQFKNGNHRLFISNSDEMFDETFPVTVANYQFLSTLDIQEESRKSLLMPSLHAAWTLRQSYDSMMLYYLYRQGKSMAFWDDPESTELVFGDPVSGRATIAELLQKNSRLMYTAAFRSLIRSDMLALTKGMSYGHLIEPGEMRYLSGDLLQLCCLLTAHLYQKEAAIFEKIEIHPENHKILKEWVKEAAALDSGTYYYAPGVPAGQMASVCRNPHLARNEHIVLESMKTGSIRNTYFGHLHGVVMMQVGKDSNVSRLGGADFDGDIVRLFYDETYRNAANAAKPDEKNPLLIPSEHAREEVYDEACRRKLVRRASGSRVGLFSNLAFQTSLFAYGARKEQQTEASGQKKDLVKLSCMVGLEIDAVKTGVKPEFVKNSFAVQKYMEDKKAEKDPYCLSFFLDYKDAVKKESQNRIRFCVPEEKYGSLTLTEYLPYIFAPDLLDIQTGSDVRIALWAKDCHALLWEKLSEKQNETGKNVRWKRRRDTLTAYQPKRVHLWELLKEIPEESDLTLELFDAYCAARALLARLRQKSKFQENGEALGTLRFVLLQNYGSKLGEEYTRKMLQWGNRLLERIGEDAPARIRAGFGRLLPWENLPGAVYRRDRFNALAQAFGMKFRCESGDDFDKYCCQLPKQPEGSELLVSILLSERTKEAFQEKLSQYLMHTDRKADTGKKIEKLRESMQKDTEEICEKVADALLKEKPCNWICETDAEKRYAFLCSVLDMDSSVMQDNQTIIRFLAAPVNWQVLPALLVYLDQKGNTLRRKKAVRMLQKQTAPFCQEGALSAACKKVMNTFKPEKNRKMRNVSGIVEALLQLEDMGIPAEEWYKAKNSDTILIGEKAVPVRIVMLYGLMRSGNYSDLQKQERIGALLESTGADSREVMLTLLGAKKKGTGFDESRNIEQFIVSVMPDTLYDSLKQASCAERIRSVEGDPYACGFLDGSQGISLMPVTNAAAGTLTVTVHTIILRENQLFDAQELQKCVELCWNGETKLQPEVRLTTDRERLVQYKRESELLRLFSVPFEIGYTDNGTFHLLCSGEVTCLRLPWECRQIASAPLKLEQIVIHYPDGTAEGDTRKTRPLDGFFWGYQMFRRIETDSSDGGETV